MEWPRSSAAGLAGTFVSPIDPATNEVFFAEDTPVECEQVTIDGPFWAELESVGLEDAWIPLVYGILGFFEESWFQRENLSKSIEAGYAHLPQLKPELQRTLKAVLELMERAASRGSFVVFLG